MPHVICPGLLSISFEKKPKKEKMQKKNSSSLHHHPSRHCFVALLKACKTLNDLKQVVAIHAMRIGSLETDLLVGTCLVGMYGKFGLLDKALYHFDRLPVRDIVAWTSLIQGYAQHGCGEEALNCFQLMQSEGVCSDLTTFVCCLQACSSIGSMEKGQEIHARMVVMGLLEGGAIAGSSLVNMYVKCGSVAKAQAAFDRLYVRNVVTWTTLIMGYSDYGLDEEALKSFVQMKKEGISPDGVTYVCALRICCKMGAIGRGKQIHAEIERLGLHNRNFDVGNALIDMYAKCGLLARAQQVFDDLQNRDSESWNILISGYSTCGKNDKAIKCFEQMKIEGVSPNSATFISTMKACSTIALIEKAQEICAEVEKQKRLETDLFLGSTLIHIYATSGFLAKASDVFDTLLVRNSVAWNALIAGYAESDHGEETVKYYMQMKIEGVRPDPVTFVCILKSCGNVGAIGVGQEIHAEVERQGLLDRGLVGNTLVDMYGKCGFLAEAYYVFMRIPVRNVVSWTAIIGGYVDNGHGEKAIECFEQMKVEDIDPDSFTYIHFLKACGSIGAKDRGEKIHAEIERRGLLQGNPVIANVLVDMYAKCGLLVQAQQVFDKLPTRDIVSWNALLTGYAEHGQGEEAMECFEQMQQDGVSPDVVTLVCVLKSCTSIGAAEKGREIHAEIERQGLLETDLFVGSTLVDMYAKCGLLRKAEQVFEKLLSRDRVSWNSLMAGYAQIGQTGNVFHTFDRMLGEGIKPDMVTFLVLLSTCRSSGLLNESHKYLEAMSKDYGIAPTVEHYVCCLGLLLRLGQLDKAVAMIMKMPFCPNLTMWHALLDSCRNWGNIEFGQRAFQHATHLDQENAVAYVLMCHLYADVESIADV